MRIRRRHREAPPENGEPRYVTEERDVGRPGDPTYVEEYEEVDSDAAEEEEVVSSSSIHYPSLSQIMAFVIGIFFVVVGGVALARVGFEDLAAETTVVGVPHTGLVGIIHIVFGALMLAAGASRGASRGLMPFLGALALAWGIMVIIEPDIGGSALAMTETNGWLYLGVGIVAIAAGILTPDLIGRRVVRRRHTDGHV